MKLLFAYCTDRRRQKSCGQNSLLFGPIRFENMRAALSVRSFGGETDA